MHKSADFYPPQHHPATAIVASVSYPAAFYPPTSAIFSGFPFTETVDSDASSSTTLTQSGTTCDNDDDHKRKKKAVSFSTEPVYSTVNPSYNLSDKQSTNFPAEPSAGLVFLLVFIFVCTLFLFHFQLCFLAFLALSFFLKLCEFSKVVTG